MRLLSDKLLARIYACSPPTICRMRKAGVDPLNVADAAEFLIRPKAGRRSPGLPRLAENYQAVSEALRLLKGEPPPKTTPAIDAFIAGLQPKSK